jgi:hypothetical protein
LSNYFHYTGAWFKLRQHHNACGSNGLISSNSRDLENDNGQTREAMMDKQLPMQGTQSFEALKQNNAHGAEYWSARDLQTVPGYSQWRRFEQAIERAITSCKESGNPPEHHFAGAGKMIEVGKGGQRQVEDYHLSRFACYLIPGTNNGDTAI